MYDLRWVPIVVAAGGDLAVSALPDAPVVTGRPRRARRRQRRLADRLVMPRPRLRPIRLEEEHA
jgi:hypothetical protein